MKILIKFTAQKHKEFEMLVLDPSPDHYAAWLRADSFPLDLRSAVEQHNEPTLTVVSRQFRPGNPIVILACALSQEVSEETLGALNYIRTR